MTLPRSAGSNVLIVNATAVKPVAGAGGLPTFRSLCRRRNVNDVPYTESIAKSWPPPGNEPGASRPKTERRGSA